MGNEERERVVALAGAMAHPFRGRVLDLLVLRSEEFSVREIAGILGEPQRKIRYHVDALANAGLIQITTEAKRRGARERRYRASSQGWISESEAELVPGDQLREISFQVLKRTLADARAAVSEGTFGVGKGHFEARVRGKVDEQGLDEVLAIYERALADVQHIFEACADRDLDGPSTEIGGALLLFRGSEGTR